MKTTILTAAAIMVAATAAASGSVTLQGVEFRSDTIAHYYIGPGVTHTHLCLTTPSRTVHTYAVTLDKADPTYTDAAKPRIEIGRDKCQTAESVTSMAARKTTADRQYLAGINGDFFITSSFANQHEFGNAILGYPNMSCVIDGKIAAPDMIDITSRENALIWGPEGMWIDATDLQYKLLNNDGSTQVKAKAVNYPRRDNELMVYNSYMGERTATAAGGREIALRPADGAKWAINKTTKFVVDGTWSNDGNMAIPADGIVISCGKNYSNAWIDGLKDGDVVKLKIVLSLPAFEGIKPDITDVIGGDVRILNSGSVTREAIRWINTPSAHYARSLVGYSQDRDRIVFAAVDGGSTSSGVSYYEAADLMAALGCYDALDFDGGGSTVLWMKHSGIANKPRDGAERAVGNALYFTLDAPADSRVASIRFADHVVLMPQYGSFTPVVYGYNAAGQLVDTAVTGCTFTTDGDAEIVDGTLVATRPGTFALKAEKDGMVATVAVTVDGECIAQPIAEAVLIDGARPYTMPLQALVKGSYMPISPEAFAWTSSDADVAAVDPSTGAVTGLHSGAAVITGTRGDFSLSYTVNVEIAPAPFIALESPFDASSWKVSRTSVSGDTYIPDADGGVTVDFDITGTRGTRLAMSKAIQLYSRPDAVTVHVEPNGAVLSNISIGFSTPTSASVKTVSSAEISGPTDVTFNIADIFDADDFGTWPVSVRSLSISPKSAPEGTKHCSIALTHLGATYSHHNSAVESVAVTTATGTTLPYYIEGGTISTPLQVASLSLYTPTGALIATSTTGTIQAPAAPGLYILTSTAPALSAKLLIK